MFVNFTNKFVKKCKKPREKFVNIDELFGKLTNIDELTNYWRTFGKIDELLGKLTNFWKNWRTWRNINELLGKLTNAKKIDELLGKLTNVVRKYWRSDELEKILTNFWENWRTLTNSSGHWGTLRAIDEPLGFTDKKPHGFLDDFFWLIGH